MAGYDEDLNQNPFFVALKQEYSKLFEQCVTQKWLICVPRRDLVPKYAVTMEDFLEHIIKPNDSKQEEIDLSRHTSHESLELKEELDSENSSTSGCSSGLNGSETSANEVNVRGGTSAWKYRTLSGVGCDYRPNQYLRLDRSWLQKNNNCCSETGSRILKTDILFEETFYTTKKRKYKLVCIDSPLHLATIDDDHSIVNELWHLKSLRDCIDFLWVKGKLSLLESYDAYIRLFLHNHSTLDNLPIPIQKDLVLTLYQKCLHLANNDPDLSSSSQNTLEAVKVATETYILNGVYRFLMGAITSALSYDDGHLNKVIRNLFEIKPQDLDIDPHHWDNLARARQELGRLDIHSSPLAKLTCLKRTLQHLHQDYDFENSPCSYLSADELLPIWLYLVVKTPLPNWNAQLQYLKNFRFSMEGQADNENSFLIATLEASLFHLKTGKVLGIVSGEKDLDGPFEITEAWLQALNHPYEEPNDIRVAEMFSAIKICNLARLEEVITEYEEIRAKQNAPVKPVDPSLLCHPLCSCDDRCAALINPPSDVVLLPPVMEVCNDDGMTLLHLACIYGRPKIVEYFVSKKYPLDLPDTQGTTALHHAATRGHQNALLLLLHAGATLEPLDQKLRTPLHFAAQNGHEACVKALIYFAEHSRQTISLSPKDINGNTPLHDASQWGFHGIVQILVENGAAINVANNRNSTPVHCAKDVHINRILQRSARRRSLVSSSHGDFINVELLPKSEDHLTDNVVMLITEPQDKKHELISNNDVPVPRQRSISTITPPSFATTGSSTKIRAAARLRRHTSIVAPTVENGLIIPENHPVNLGPDTFVISNIECKVEKRRISADESTRIRKVSVESLSNIAVGVLPELPVSVGDRVKLENQSRDMQKLMNSIIAGDVQLALFYLGIPVAELDSIHTKNERLDLIPTCHPLCPCKRCVAKSAGLGLDINMRSANGFTALHVAIQCGLLSLVQILYRYGADINLRTGDNISPLKFAKNKRQNEIAYFLLLHGAAE